MRWVDPGASAMSALLLASLALAVCTGRPTAATTAGRQGVLDVTAEPGARRRACTAQATHLVRSSLLQNVSHCVCDAGYTCLAPRNSTAGRCNHGYLVERCARHAVSGYKPSECPGCMCARSDQHDALPSGGGGSSTNATVNAASNTTTAAAATSPGDAGCCSWDPTCGQCLNMPNWCGDNSANCAVCGKNDAKIHWCTAAEQNQKLKNCSEPISVNGGTKLAYNDPRIADYVQAGGCLEHLQAACEGSRSKRSLRSINDLRMVLALLQYLGIPAMPIDGAAIALAGGWGHMNLPWDDDIDLIIDVEGKQQLLGLYGYGNSSRRQDDPAAGLVDITGTDDGAAMLGSKHGQRRRKSTQKASMNLAGAVYRIAAHRSEGIRGNGTVDSDWGQASKELLRHLPGRSDALDHYVAIRDGEWGFFSAHVLEPGCDQDSCLDGRWAHRHVADLGFPACSGRRMDFVKQSMLGPGPGCVVAGAPETKFGNAIPGAIEDVSANGASKTAAIWEAQVKFARRAFATRIPAPVALVGVNLEGLSVPRDAVAEYDVYLRARYGERWNSTAMICPHKFFNSFASCNAAKIHPAAVRATMELIPACREIL